MKIDRVEAERRAKQVAVNLGASLPIANALWPLVAEAILQARNDTAEECAGIAEREKVNAAETGHPADEVYNQACEDIAREIRGIKGE